MKVRPATARELRKRADEVEVLWSGLFFHPRDGWNEHRGASARQIAGHMRLVAERLEAINGG